MDSFAPSKQTLASRSVVIAIVIVAVAVVAILVAAYSGFLGARYAPGLAFRVLGPDTLPAGSTAIVQWDTRPENQRRFPSEKIEFCRGRIFRQQCVTLNPDTPNDGEALVFVPNVPLGDGFLRLTARLRPGGPLQTRFSSTRPVRVRLATAQERSAVGPVNLGDGVIGSLGPVGPRVRVAQESTRTIVLPEPSVNKKVELCRREGGRDRCQTLAASVSGAAVNVRFPTGNTGRAYVKVSERGADGRLTGKVFYRRAVLVTEPSPTRAADAGDGDGDGGEDRPAPPPRQQASARFTSPTSRQRVVGGTPLLVHVLLQETKVSQITCGQITLDGQPIPNSAWAEPPSRTRYLEAC